MDSNGNLFFVLLNPLALVCWDSTTPYTRANIKIVYQNDATLQFASGLKVVWNYNNIEEVWIMTNRFQVWDSHRFQLTKLTRIFFFFQKIAAGTINANEVNFRIQGQTIPALLNNQYRCNGKALPWKYQTSWSFKCKLPGTFLQNNKNFFFSINSD